MGIKTIVRIISIVIILAVHSGCTYFSDESIAERYVNDGKLEQGYDILKSKKSQTYRSLLLQGIILERQELYSEAVEILSKAIEIHRGEKAFFYRGWAWTELGNFNNAIDDFSQVAKLSPHKTDAFSGLGTVYLRSNQDAMAVKTFQKALKIAPRNIDLSAQYIRALYCNNEEIKALVFLSRLPDEIKDDSRLRIEMAWVLCTSSRMQEKDGIVAEKMLNDMAAQCNKTAIFWEVKAAVDAKSGNFHEAKQSIDKAISLSNSRLYDSILKMEQKAYNRNILPPYRDLSRNRPFLIRK